MTPIIHTDTVGQEFYLNLDRGEATSGLSASDYRPHSIKEVHPGKYLIYQKKNGKPQRDITRWEISLNNKGELIACDEFHRWKRLDVKDSKYQPAPNFVHSLKEIVESWMPKKSESQYSTR